MGRRTSDEGPDLRHTATTLQAQARALGDPTRHGIFVHLVDAARPVDVAELTEAFGVNHNAVRQHLAKLLAAGLVHESTAARTGPGRPRLVYTVAPAAQGRWGTVGPYERLAVLLAEVTRTGDSPVEVGRRAGRRFAVADGPAEASISDIAAAMASEGFDPEVRAKGRRVEVVLHTCPFSSAVLADRDTVCDLHLGLAEGMASCADGVEVDELVAKDPRRAGCRLKLRVGTS